MTQRTQTSPQRQNWDTRAWFVGILGGVSGSLGAWAVYPPLHRWLYLPVNPLEHQITDFLNVAGCVTGVLVLPGLLSSLARRWTFIWGLLPLSLFLVSVDLEHWVDNGSESVQYFWVNLVIVSGCWIISSGPISLFLWLRVRAARHHAALLASYQAGQRAVGSQEGVWPPPPEYRDL